MTLVSCTKSKMADGCHIEKLRVATTSLA